MKTQLIADFLSAELVGDPGVEIRSVADVSNAGSDQIAFAENAGSAAGSAAGCLLIPLDASVETKACVIRIADPKLAFARVAEKLHPAKIRPAEIHPSAVISETARIGKNVFVGAFAAIGEGSTIGDSTQLLVGAKVGENVVIGKSCILHPNVTIEDGCTLGDNVILHTGVVIGADGFGYVRDRDGYVKFPQVGTVIIENDVEIGANSCVDRGALGETRIGSGTKIDNLVQIAHNVQVGRRVVIAAQTGISGSCVVEDGVVIAGQVGIADHATIRSGAVLGAQAGILPGKIVRPGVWWGTPVQPLDDFKRQNAHVKGLERLKAEVKAIRDKLDVFLAAMKDN